MLPQCPLFVNSAGTRSLAPANVTNITVTDLPADLDSIHSSHNGPNYLAYTFHVTNTGKYTVTYEYHLYIVNVTNNVDEAVRVRFYVNGDYVDYAKTRSDGSGPAALPLTHGMLPASTGRGELLCARERPVSRRGRDCG